jgi:OHCU decarboxylase
MDVSDTPGATAASLSGANHPWRPLLAPMRLQADARHWFEAELQAQGPVTHARFNVFPDGGVSRLRLYGRVTGADRKELGLRRLDTRLPKVAARELFACAGSLAALYEAADDEWSRTTEADWREAIVTHPRIGETAGKQGATSSAWSQEEQSRALEATDARAALAEMNRKYEARFGVRYIVCATGKPADELVRIAEARLANDPEAELRVVGSELHKITRLRLDKLLEP